LIKKLTKWQTLKNKVLKFSIFSFFGETKKNQKNITLVPMIIIDVLNNMLKLHGWSSSFFVIVYADQNDNI